MGSTQRVTRNQGMHGCGAGGSAELVAAPWGRPVSSVPVSQSSASRPPRSPSRYNDVPGSVRVSLMSIAVGDHVASDVLADAFLATVDLPAPTRDVVLGSLMTAAMARGPVADDIEALLRAALAVDGREPAEVITGGGRPVLMLAGSGKKGVRTLNVSTPAALVAAAAEARVIKVGSAATSSAMGSRDLVRALGIRENRTAEGVRADLDACGFAFVAIEPEIPILDELYGGRFHAPNPFSFGLAPLASPVRGDITLFGLSHPRVDVAARVLSRFGMDDVDVLTTRLPTGRYLDEIGPAGEVRWCRVRNGEVGPVGAEPADHPTTTVPHGVLPVPEGPQEAIERTGELLAGRGLDSHRAIVALNAAHLLVLGGIAASFQQGRDMADDILRSGVTLASTPMAPTAEMSA